MPAYSQNVEMASFVTARDDGLSVPSIVGFAVASFVTGMYSSMYTSCCLQLRPRIINYIIFKFCPNGLPIDKIFCLSMCLAMTDKNDLCMS